MILLFKEAVILPASLVCIYDSVILLFKEAVILPVSLVCIYDSVVLLLKGGGGGGGVQHCPCEIVRPRSKNGAKKPIYKTRR